MTNTYEELLNASKNLEKSEKINFIYNYFLNNVKYDYDLLYAGFIMSGIKHTEKIFENINFKNDKDVILKMILTRDICIEQDNGKVLKKYCNFYEKILKLQEKLNIKELNNYKKEALNIFINDYYDFIKNKALLNSGIDKFNNQVLNRSYVPYKLIDKKSNIYSSYDITNMIVKTYKDNNYKLKENGIYENGLLKSGVCRHFSFFLSKYLSDNNIESVYLIGKAELPHIWNMIMIDDKIKFIDISSELHIRDNTCYPDLKQGSFYLIDIDKLFELDPNRIIQRVGNFTLLPVDYITKDNYKSEKSKQILKNAFKQKLEIKVLVKK